MTRSPFTSADVVLYSGKINGITNTKATDFTLLVPHLRDPGSSGPGRTKSAPDGRDPACQRYLLDDPRAKAAIEAALIHIYATLRCPDPRRWTDLAFLDHTGKWIAPALVEALADRLMTEAKPFAVFTKHLELEGV